MVPHSSLLSVYLLEMTHYLTTSMKYVVYEFEMKDIPYPCGELLAEGLPEGRAEVVVLGAVVDLMSRPQKGHF